MNRLKYLDTPCHPFDNCETVVNNFFQAVHNFFPLHHSFCQFCPVFVHDLSKILSTKLSTEQQSCFRLFTILSKVASVLDKMLLSKKNLFTTCKKLLTIPKTRQHKHLEQLANIMRTKYEHRF